MFSDLPKNEQEVLLKYPNYNNDYIRQHFQELDNLTSKGILKKEINTSSWMPPIYLITKFGEKLLNDKK